MLRTFMKRPVFTVTATTNVREAARLVVERRIGTLPVVDAAGKLIGIVRLEDLLRVFMPDFVSLFDNLDFVHDFGVLERRNPGDVSGAGERTMASLMQPPIFVSHTGGLLRAFATLEKHDLRDLPVVDEENVLVGIVSHVDIAVAYLSQWDLGEPA